MKKITLLFAALLMAAAGATAQTWDCGASGNNVTATLDNGTLTISGTGAMADFTDVEAIPWYDKQYLIKTLIITEGVTSIGDYAFMFCDALAEVAIPGSVTSIGEMAFLACEALAEVTIPSGVATISSGAFGQCPALHKVVNLRSEPQSVVIDVFGLLEASMELFVPSSAKAAYEISFRWRDFGAISSLEDYLAAKNRQIGTLQGEVAGLKEDTAFLGANNRNLTENLAVTAAALNEANSTLTLRNQAIELLKYDTLRLSNSVKTLQTENQTLTASNTKLTSDTVRLYNIAATLQTQNRTLAASISQLTQQLADCESNGGNQTAVSSAQQSAVKIYPNPISNEQLTVDNEQWEENEAVEVYSISGALVAKVPTAGERTSVSVSQLPSGTYIVKVGKYAGKFVKR